MANPNEDELMAELARLEKSTISKGGDALQNAPHDGGFATEGTNIQSKANVKKALMKGGMSEEDADKTIALMKGFGEDESSSPGEGDEGTSSPDEDSESAEPPMEKSLGAASLANASKKQSKKEDSIRKSLSDETNEAINAVPVLDALVKSIDKLAKGAGVDSEVRKSLGEMKATQDGFNKKVAAALTLIAKSQNEVMSLVKSIEAQPQAQRAPTIRKSEIVEPNFHDNGQGNIGGITTGTVSPLASVPMLDIQNALVDIVMKGGADPMDVTKFENSKGNFNLLPPNVVKQLETRFQTAAS